MSEEQLDDTQVQKQLGILKEIEQNPEIKQKNIASRLGIGIGTVNWYIKRLSKKGYVKIKRIGQWKWKYILTPEGVTEKARLTKHYIENSMELYRKTRNKAKTLLYRVKQKDHNKVCITGDNDLVDVCRLTAIEMDINVVDSSKDKNCPVLKVDGHELTLTDDGFD